MLRWVFDRGGREHLSFCKEKGCYLLADGGREGEVFYISRKKKLGLGKREIRPAPHNGGRLPTSAKRKEISHERKII